MQPGKKKGNARINSSQRVNIHFKKQKNKKKTKKAVSTFTCIRPENITGRQRVKENKKRGL